MLQTRDAGRPKNRACLAACVLHEVRKGKKNKKKGQVRKEKRGNEEEERRRGAKATQSVETTEKPR